MSLSPYMFSNDSSNSESTQIVQIPVIEPNVESLKRPRDFVQFVLEDETPKRPEKKIKIGEEFQTVLPPLQQRPEVFEPDERLGTLVWRPDMLSDEEVDKYVEDCKQLLVPSNGRCNQDAVHEILHRHQYDVDVAFEYVQMNLSEIREKEWTPREKAIAARGFAEHYKELELVYAHVADELGKTRSYADLVNYYFINKYSLNLRKPRSNFLSYINFHDEAYESDKSSDSAHESDNIPHPDTERDDSDSFNDDDDNSSYRRNKYFTSDTTKAVSTTADDSNDGFITHNPSHRASSVASQPLAALSGYASDSESSPYSIMAYDELQSTIASPTMLSSLLSSDYNNTSNGVTSNDYFSSANRGLSFTEADLYNDFDPSYFTSASDPLPSFPLGSSTTTTAPTATTTALSQNTSCIDCNNNNSNKHGIGSAADADSTDLVSSLFNNTVTSSPVL